MSRTYTIEVSCRCCGKILHVPPEDALDLCAKCFRGKGGDTDDPCNEHLHQATPTYRGYGSVTQQEGTEKGKDTPTPTGLVHLHLQLVKGRWSFVVRTGTRTVLCGTTRCRPVKVHEVGPE